MMIDNTNNKQCVYMFKCQVSTLVVKGNINSIIVGKWSLEMLSQHNFNVMSRIQKTETTCTLVIAGDRYIKAYLPVLSKILY